MYSQQYPSPHTAVGAMPVDDTGQIKPFKAPARGRAAMRRLAAERAIPDGAAALALPVSAAAALLTLAVAR